MSLCNKYNLYGLYGDAIKNRPFDVLLENLAARFSYSFFQCLAPFRVEDYSLEDRPVFFARKSNIDTRELEKKFFVYPELSVRERCADKLALYKYCQQNSIPMPETFLVEELLTQFIFKHLSTGSRSVIDMPFVGRDIVCQKKLAGEVVKLYICTIYSQVLAYNEKTLGLVDVPEEIVKLSVKIASDHGLILGGIDWLVNEKDSKWYLIDLNATLGFANLRVAQVESITHVAFGELFSRAKVFYDE